MILTCTGGTHWTLGRHKQLGLWIRRKNQGVSMDVCIAVVIPLKIVKVPVGKGLTADIFQMKKKLCGGYEISELT